MSILGNIVSGIFKSSTPAATAGTPPGPSHPAPPVSTATATAERAETKTSGQGASAGSTGATTLEKPSTAAPLEHVDVAAVLTKLAEQNREKLDWRRSVVDLMKLLNLDSSFAARKQLAKELHYAGDMSDSAAMNIWLHRQVMQKLAENGGKVPADLTAK